MAAPTRPVVPAPADATTRVSAGPDLARYAPAGGWFALLIATYPLAWALGIAPLVWMLAAVPMGLWMLRQPRVMVPRGSAIWAVFIVAMFLSFVRLDSAGRIGTWSLRTGWCVAATICALYLLNQPSRRTPIVIVRSLVALWAIAISGGWLGIVAPRVSWTGPLARIIPGPILSNGLVSDLTSPAFAEIQTVGGAITLDRPTAPFAYSNSWGSTVALLTPFVIAAFSDRRIGIPRPLVVLALAAALPPFILSLNRGSWLTLAVGVAYGVLCLPQPTRRRAARLLAALGAVTLVIGLATGALSQVVDQIGTRSRDSNETRTSLYEESFEQTLQSPLIGHGTPRPSTVLPDGPPIGTHGQLWTVMYSHGFLAAAAYAGFFVYIFLLSRPDVFGGGTAILLWSRVALLIGVIQLPIYGHLPQQLFTMMAAVALIHLERLRAAPSG